MQRAAFPELQGQPRPSRHRKPERPDRILIGLKVATGIAAAGLLTVVVLLISAGVEAPAANRSPAVPKIVPSPGDDAPAATTTSTQLQPPDLQSDTQEIAGQPAPTTTSRSPRPTRTQKPPPRQPGFEFAVIGERCPKPGAFSITKESEPVMCFRRSPTDEPRWLPVF
jgi:hypothetical protein